MRISQDHANRAIAIIAKQYKDAPVWLFGSRANDSKRGGDVDIYVESDRQVALIDKIRCQMALSDMFDLKVDLVVGIGDKPIQRIAKSTGIRLK